MSLTTSSTGESAVLASGSTAATPSNLVEVASPEHFTDLMQRDLTRVSLLNFWAPWAEPCKQMNEVVKELAAKYPQVLCLMIEAEALPDVSESFDVEAVPSFVLLRGHTLLTRISGANAAALSNALAVHAATSRTGGASGHESLSKTSAQPRAAADTYVAANANGGSAVPYAEDEEEQLRQETEEEIFERCRKLMDQEEVMLFMKGDPDTPRCGFSQKTVNLLRQEGVKFGHYDILKDENVRQGLKKLNEWPTFPQIIVKGELIGGLDILKEQIESGEFKELLQG